MGKVGHDAADVALAACAVGLCLASTETGRYSALWTVGGGSSPQVFLAHVASVLAGGALVMLACAGGGRRRRGAQAALALALAGLQSASFAMRFLAAGSGGSSGVGEDVVQAMLSASSYALLMMMAARAQSWRLDDSLAALAGGVCVTAIVQAVMVVAPAGSRLGIGVALAPAAAALLVALWAREARVERWLGGLSDAERAVFMGEDGERGAQGEAAAPPGARPLGGGARALLCAIVLLSSYLVAVLHGTWLGGQDGGAASGLIQLCSAIGTLAAGYLVLAMRRRAGDPGLFGALWLLVLPVLLGTLYLATLLEGAVVALVVIPLNIANVAVLFFIWAAPSVLPVGSPSAFCVALFVAKRLGNWLPSLPRALGTPAAASTAMTACCLALLLVLCVWQYARFSAAQRAADVSSGGLGRGLALACDRVARRCGLTPREREVLPVLARGRNAEHVARELCISEATARTHIMHIYQKAGVRSQQALMDVVDAELEAMRQGG